MFKNIIKFSHHLGQTKRGVDRTPYIFCNKNNPYLNQIECPITDSLHKNIENLYLENKKIESKRINIGGDHSMSIATVTDSLEKYNDNLKLIWMDAHSDINTYKSSSTKNYHGMPLSILTGLDMVTRSSFKFLKNKPFLKFENILYLGIREMDSFEEEVLDKYKIKYINVNEINNFAYNTLNQIEDFVEDNPIHLSFDVDVVDPFYIPSTGTPVGEGLNLESTGILLNNIMKYNLVSMDLTELNLAIGNKEDKLKSLNNVRHLMKGIVY